MNFVLLGDDPVCLPLLRAIARAPEHDLTLAAHAGDLWPEVAAGFPHARQTTDWQALLIEPGVTAVIVAGHSPVVLEGAKSLARAGIPLAVFPDVRQTSSFVYELWPIEDEGRTKLIPLWRHVIHDVVGTFREQSHPKDGALQFLQYERTLPQGPDGRLSLSEFENSLLDDADLLRQLGGDYSRVTCVPFGLSGDRIAMLSVTLAGDGLPEATWRLSVGEGPATSRLTFTCKGGSLSVDPSQMPADGQPADAGLRWLEIVEQRLSPSSDVPRWSEVIRAFDIVDAARRSIRRKRTIEIGSEEISEVRQFKSLMTAAGCGVLTYTLFGVIAALLIGAVADPRDAAQRRAAAAGFIVRADEFVADSANLTQEGAAHVEEIAPRLWQTTADVIIEPAVPGNAAVDGARQSTVEHALETADAAKVAGRVVIRPLTGDWFEHAMLGVWAIVFAPLVILLALQLLGLAARRTDGP